MTRRAAAEAERRKLVKALIDARGIRTDAAQRLAIPLAVLLAKLKEHGIE